MRPRLFAAENGLAWLDFVCSDMASMRPRLFAAENQEAVRASHSPSPASMRPRLFAAENGLFADVELVVHVASMRPRLFAAENHALRSGEPGQRLASMRPRLFAAENRAFRLAELAGEMGFNEAAAFRRGELTSRDGASGIAIRPAAREVRRERGISGSPPAAVSRGRPILSRLLKNLTLRER